nr:reverse transcriptase domain-containing protein [Tanacetum cinerariifolium]
MNFYPFLTVDTTLEDLIITCPQVIVLSNGKYYIITRHVYDMYQVVGAATGESCQYLGLPGDDANKNIEKFLTVTPSMKQNGVPHDVLRLCFFPYSLTHHATAWFDRLLKNSIHSWVEMVIKFLSKYFPPSMVTKLRDDIGNFRQLPDESLFEAWNVTRYLNSKGNFLRMSQSNQQVNVVNLSCKTYGGPHHYSKWQAASGFTQGDVYAATGNYNTRANQMTKIEKSFNERPRGALPSNTIPNPREDIKVNTIRSGITLARPSVPSPNSSSSSSSKEPSNHYPLRLNKDKLQDKSNIQIHKFLWMFKKLHFNISFAEALAQMPKYAKMLKDLLTNKEKLLELANTPLNENCSAILIKKLPEKFKDLGKFLIPYDFSELKECLALADLEDLPPKELKNDETKTTKSLIKEPPELEFKELPPHIEGIDPNFCTHKILMEDDFELAVQHQRREKCHFMVKVDIVLGHKISKNGIEVDHAKVDVIAKLPPPTTVKGIRSFLGHSGFYRRFIQDFSKIVWPMTHLLEKETLLIFLKEFKESFVFIKKKLTEAPILVALD